MNEIRELIVTAPSGRRYRLTVSAEGSRWKPIDAHFAPVPVNLAKHRVASSWPAREGTTMAKTLEFDAADVARMREVHKQALRLQADEPSLEYNDAVIRASKEREDLDRAARRRLSEERSLSGREARMLHDASRAAADSEDLYRDARRRMADDPSLTIKAAVIAASAARPRLREAALQDTVRDETSGAALDDSTQSTPVTKKEIEDYAAKNNVSYKQALLELDAKRKED